jgi:hypothetical protein
VQNAMKVHHPRPVLSIHRTLRTMHFFNYPAQNPIDLTKIELIAAGNVIDLTKSNKMIAHPVSNKIDTKY